MLSRLTRKLHTLARHIEEPRLFALRRLGVPLDIYEKLAAAWLRSFQFATVLDVGANVGQFALAANAVWPEARIYSFEPLPDCYQQLLVRLAQVKNFTGFNLGLGDKPGSLVFERNAFSASSSFLRMAPTHKSEFPHTRDSQQVTVEVKRLDDVVAKLSLGNPILLKIDVQGFEDKVLLGGEATIQKVEVIIIESSFEVLYEEQPLFDDIYRAMIHRGFVYKGAMDQMVSPKDGRPLQTDAIFMRPTTTPPKGAR
jgi:FkbM family methyltransferase